MRQILVLAVMILGLSSGRTALAQGEDSSFADRDIMVLAEMLPGRYDNMDQFYFDRRLKIPEEDRHERLHSIIARVELPAFGPYAFYVQDYRNDAEDKPYRQRIYSLSVDEAAQAVRMKIYYLEGEKGKATLNAHKDPSKLAEFTPENTFILPGCDVFWRREAGQFKGEMKGKDCTWKWPGKGEVYTDYSMLLSQEALWTRDLTLNDDGDQFTGKKDRSYYRLARAREFSCYADVPGVSGGVDTPYKRYDGLKVHDKGGTDTFTLDDGRTLQLRLRNVDWPINNYKGVFTRNSFVIYLAEADGEGGWKSISYSFTEPTVTRLGMNLRWILTYCFTESNATAKPEF